MGGVDDLIMWFEFLFKVLEEIFLGLPVQRQTRLIQQQDDVLPVSPELRIPRKKREEPNEPA